MVEIKLRNKTSSSTLETSKPNIKRGVAWSALALSALLAGACEKLPAEPNDETSQALPPCSDQVGPPNCIPEAPETSHEPVDICQALGDIASALSKEPVDINGVADNIQSLADEGLDSDPTIEQIIIDFGALNPDPNDETLVETMQQDVMAAQNGFNC